MVNKEIDLKDVVRTLLKNKKFIIYFTLTIIILTLIATLLWPKVYESVSVIQLARLDTIKDSVRPSGEIFTVIEAKAIAESSEILMPAIEKYLDEQTSLEDFKRNNLEVLILQETIGRDQKPINYIQIKVKYKDPEIAQKINLEITYQFFNYTLPYYNKVYDVLSKDLTETNNNIAQIEEDILDTENQINSLSNQQLTTEGISKSTLLTNILSSYKSRLTTEQDKRNNLEESIANKREYQIISEPQVSNKPVSPNILLNILVALIAGIFFAVIYVFLKEDMK